MEDSRPLICYVSSNTDGGGDGRYIFELARRLSSDRFRRVVISCDSPGTMALELQKVDAPVFSLDLPEEPLGLSRPWWRFVGLVQMRSLLSRMRPDLVHTVGFRAGLLGRVAARMVGTPRVVSSYRRPAQPAGLEGLLARLSAGAADLNVGLGRSMAALARQRWNIHPRRMMMIDPGVDLARVRDWPAAEDLGLGGPVIGCVGTLSHARGQDVLIQATRILRRQHPRLQLVLAGVGPEGLPLLRLSQRLGLEDAVLLPGFRTDMGPVLHALDVFVLPARRAGIPFSLLEAQAARRPIVASDLPAVRDVMDQNVHGLLVPPGQPGPLAAAIGQLLANPEQARRLAHAGQARVLAHHQAHQMFTRHLEIYEGLLGRTPENPAG